MLARRGCSMSISRRRGFTLVEIMAVVVILAGLWVLLLPSMSTRDDLVASAAARVVIADLIYAQNRAISTQQMHFVSFAVGGSGTNGGYAIYDQQPFTTPVINNVTLQPYTLTFGSGGASRFSSITLSGLNLDGSTNTVLAFDELGQPMACTVTGAPVALAAAGTITLQSGSQSVTLSIEPGTGNITMP